MGVHGLTTYLRENRRTLGSHIEFRSPVSGADVLLVVDGWSFLYELQRHALMQTSWVYGGEYSDFARLVGSVVKMWIAVGFQLHFVFDGPHPPAKFGTIENRITKAFILPSQLFFRTSPVSRMSVRSLRETYMLPPFIYATCVHILRTLAEADPDGIQIYHADEEGDPFAVDLAARLGAYVTGNDSDYVVLNAEGYKGYIPMEEMQWEWASALPVDGDTNLAQGDGWFEPVKKGKKKTGTTASHSDPSRRMGFGLLPPEVDVYAEEVPSDLSFSCTVYHPTKLAAQLAIGTNLLPLLGALVGNDYTQTTSTNPRSFHKLFFDYQMTLSQRIMHVAKILRQQIAPPPPSYRKNQQSQKSGTQIIEAAVDKLLNRDKALIGSGERERIVDAVAEATLQYALVPAQGLHVSRFCPLHEGDACPLVEVLTDGTEDEDVMQAEIRRRYIAAYRAGQLSPRLVDIVSTKTVWPRIFLENPDLEATARSIGKSLREWTYALLDEAVGLPENEDQDVSFDVDSDDELIDVAEVQTDSEEEGDSSADAVPPEDPLISALAPKLQRLLERRAFHSGVVSPMQVTRPGSPGSPTMSQAFSISQLSGLSSSFLRHAKKVQERIRRGTRLGEVEVVVRSFAALQEVHGWPAEWYGSRTATPDIPLVLRDEEERLQVFLRIVNSGNIELEAISPQQLTAVAAVRYTVGTLAKRAQERGTKDSAMERWTTAEARAVLAGFVWDIDPSSNKAAQDASDPVVETTVENRNVQIVAQFFAAIEAIIHLAQTLLLADRVAHPLPLFSGQRCHSALLAIPLGDATSTDLPAGMWDKVVDGLETAFSPERGKRTKKDRRVVSPPMSKSPSARSGMSVNSTTASMYSVLSGLDG